MIPSKATQQNNEKTYKTASVEGIPTTVTVSEAFLEKCMNDPEKAKYLESNLNAITESVSRAKAGSFGTLTYISYAIDANGNISMLSGGNK